MALAAAGEISVAKIVIPSLQKHGLVLSHDTLDVSHNCTAQAARIGQSYRLQPKLGNVTVPLNVYVRRLSTVS